MVERTPEHPKHFRPVVAGKDKSIMMLRTTSHRSRHGVDRVLGRHPQYYWTFNDGGCFLKLDDPKEIEAVLKIKGVSKCRDQNEESYGQCWSARVV